MAKYSAVMEMLLAARRKSERRYRRLLLNVWREIDKRIEALPNPTPESIERTLNQMLSMPTYEALCREAAHQMATMMAVEQKHTWRAAAAESSQARRIYNALMKHTASTGQIGQTISQIVNQNATLIKTVPQSIAGELSRLARQREFEGIRPEELTKEVLAKASHLKKFEAKRIARTESAKASTALVQARAESLGLDFYVWRTCRDERVRDSHIIMNGVICRWSDPPCPEALNKEKRTYGNYPPGGIFNCRCIALPIVDIDTDIKFPVKVHKGGQIYEPKNLNEFKRLFEIT